MTAPTFGMQFTRPLDEPVPVIGADFSKILIIESSEDASAVDSAARASSSVRTPVRTRASSRVRPPASRASR